MGSAIPGANVLEKTLVVLGLLLFGLALYSRVNGQSFTLGLTGFSGPGGSLSMSSAAAAGVNTWAQPRATVASQAPAPSMLNRIAQVNPARAS